MANRYDAIVIGLGGMGAASAFHLARRGQRVLGLEQYELAARAWLVPRADPDHPARLPRASRPTSRCCGAATSCGTSSRRSPASSCSSRPGSSRAGPEDGPTFRGALRPRELHDLSHEVLEADELRRRHPAYVGFEPDDARGVPARGWIPAGRAHDRQAHVNGALALGADLHFREPVLAWEATAEGGVRVTTERGEYEADRLVIYCRSVDAAAGPAPRVAGGARAPGTRVAAADPAGAVRARPLPGLPDRCREGSYYGFPVHDVPGFKFGALPPLREPIDPDDPDRTARPDDEASCGPSPPYFPEGAGPTMMLKACIFTNSPDEHFIIDRLPDAPQVSVAAACSGHGYKFCSVVGEIMADLATTDETDHDIGLFRLDRFDDADEAVATPPATWRPHTVQSRRLSLPQIPIERPRSTTGCA